MGGTQLKAKEKEKEPRVPHNLSSRSQVFLRLLQKRAIKVVDTQLKEKEKEEKEAAAGVQRTDAALQVCILHSRFAALLSQPFCVCCTSHRPEPRHRPVGSSKSKP